VITPTMNTAVRNLLAEHIGNPARRAARAARAQYIGDLIAANLRGDDVDREVADWLRRLVELCSPFADVADVARWYANERQRPEKLLPRTQIGEHHSRNDQPG
jgi:hypothetical protein